MAPTDRCPVSIATQTRFPVLVSPPPDWQVSSERLISMKKLTRFGPFEVMKGVMVLQNISMKTFLYQRLWLYEDGKLVE